MESILDVLCSITDFTLTPIVWIYSLSFQHGSKHDTILALWRFSNISLIHRVLFLLSNCWYSNPTDVCVNYF